MWKNDTVSVREPVLGVDPTGRVFTYAIELRYGDNH
jgi:hypothetical protein